MAVSGTPNPQQDALNGWNHLGQVLAVWIPARLKVTHTATSGMRALRRAR